MKSIRTQDEGVSKVRKKITALTVVFSLIIAMFAGACKRSRQERMTFRLLV